VRARSNAKSNDLNEVSQKSGLGFSNRSNQQTGKSW